MKKQELQELVQECIAEVLNEKYSEFQRVDKGSKDVAAKDKAEEDTYGAGYAAGERAAKAKYKKLAEAYKALKEVNTQIEENQTSLNEVDMQEILPALIASGLLSTAAISAVKQAMKDPKKFIDDVRKQGKNPGSIGPQ